jgi:hypothetical protein
MSRVIVGEPIIALKPTTLDGDHILPQSQPQAQTTKSDGYIERVIKYIPAEVVAFYVFVNSLLAGLAKEPLASLKPAATSEEIKAKLIETTLANHTISLMAVSNVMLVLAACMAVVYLYVQHDPEEGNEYVGLNAVVSFVGFFVWAYAVDAVALRPWHDGILASLILASFSLVSGAISPNAQNKVMNKLGDMKRAALSGFAKKE